MDSREVDFYGSWPSVFAMAWPHTSHRSYSLKNPLCFFGFLISCIAIHASSVAIMMFTQSFLHALVATPLILAAPALEG